MQNSTLITMVWELYEQGVPKSRIAMRLCRHWETVHLWIKGIEQYGLLPFLDRYEQARKRLRQLPYATRKPEEYRAEGVGDIVELDTLDVIRPLPGVLFKHFTAHDVISRWNVLSVHSRATATTAATFLDSLIERMPFPVRAIQVDGGSEFESVFESECQRRNVKLFVLPPRSPKLNGGVERAHRTHTEEFYEVTDSSFELAELREELLEWERIYNMVRPHQSLGYLTPLKFLQKERRQVSLII